ncbi:methyltransferase domain-containing protein [Ruegeria sp. 6PALISEP08]|uniref:methyltransferase domain-containing protein n=1 Tax=Ruegeria sp. 6PALISEP08 TaxID=1225660 RepID=UPI00067ED79C|nr:methyltransferase domain-containing protein [Ruegeria sp. 6PALISEP08]
MSDPYADLASQDKELQKRIADAIDIRSQDLAQKEIRQAYLADIKLPPNASAVELGSGTGYVTQDLISMAGAKTALGVEPSPVMVERANLHFADIPNLSFVIGDARQTGLPDDAFDIVLMHTLLCHVPGPEKAIHEAYRILKPGGVLAICDGDYSTATARIADFDPLDQLVRFMINQNVTNLWIMRQISGLLTRNGFALGAFKGHGYVAEGQAEYFLTVIDRGADRLVEEGVLQPDTGEALKQEARDRVAQNTFFGYMSYVSQIAYKQ